MSDGDTKYDRLEGLHPMFADWHLKRTFSEVREKSHCSGIWSILQVIPFLAIDLIDLTQSTKFKLH